MTVTRESFDAVEEIRKILGSVDGAKRVDENIVMEYVVVVPDEEAASRVEKVGAELSKQAEKHGFVLDITAATEQQMKEAELKLAEFLRENSKFKA